MSYRKTDLGILVSKKSAKVVLAGPDPVEQQTRAIEKEMRDVQAANQLGLSRREYTRRKALGNDLCSQVGELRELIDCKDRVLRTGR